MKLDAPTCCATLILSAWLAACTGSESNPDGASGDTTTSGSGGTTASGNAASSSSSASGGSGASTPGPPSGDFDCRADGDGITTAVFVNGCGTELHVRGSDIDDATIAPGAFACRDLGTADEELSAKRYWGFLEDDPGAEHHTLAELTFNTDFEDFDWYNISHVDAHNLTMQIAPLDRDDCDTLTCADPSLLLDCPDVGLTTNADGDLIACYSPERDNPDSAVALHFESCDDGYAWSGDDQHGDDPSPVRACAGEDWAIVFCP